MHDASGGCARPPGSRPGQPANTEGGYDTLKVSTHFSKSRRLLTPADFKQVFDSTLLKRSTDDCLMCLAAPAAGPRGRIGLAIAKRSVRRAVGRNLVKRVVRDHYRRQGQALDDHDIVVLGRHDTAAASAQALATSIEAHFARLLTLEFRPARPRPSKRRGHR